MKTQVEIIAGFLGAGKTTLIRKLIQEAFVGEKVVLIENEFGEIGIDGGFLQDAGIEITAINSGCICCSLRGDFKTALQQAVAQFTPDRILIEPSGVGKLSDIVSAIRQVEEVEVHTYTTVVDGPRCTLYAKNFGEFFNDQIAYAKCVILSKTRKLDDEKLKEDEDLVRSLNPTCTLIATPWEELDGKTIFDAMSNAQEQSITLAITGEEEDEEEEHHHHDQEEEHHHHDHDHEEGHEHHHHHHHHHDGEHDADEIFTSVGYETVKVFTEEELKAILEKMPDAIVRAKGIVKSTGDTWLFFDYVPQEIEIRLGNPAYNGLITVIGTEVKEQEIKELFGI